MQQAASPITSGVTSTAQSSRIPGQREQFTPEELSVVLSHFDIGIIDSIVEFPRGSRKAPKLLIVSEQGKFLLKRRARGKDDPFKVAFCHAIQLYLASKQFPLPHLIGTRRENNSMLQWRNSVYELFEYIPGQAYPQTLEATFDGGRVLALYHKLLDNFKSEFQPPTGSYHRATAVEQGLKAIMGTLGSNAGMPTTSNSAAAAGSGLSAGTGAGSAGAGVIGASGATCAELVPLLASLLESYDKAAQMVESLGLPRWPRQIVHADWHPGNMLYRDNHVVAVIDYDSARLLPRIIDIANGALQFSIIGGDDDIGKWPEYVDESRFKRFLRGYDEVVLLSQAEVKTVPYLMIEALIAEAVFPIAATGTFGRMNGVAFLQMVQRKVAWLFKSADMLVELAES